MDPNFVKNSSVILKPCKYVPTYVLINFCHCSEICHSFMTKSRFLGLIFKNAVMNDALMTLVTLFLVSVVQLLRLIGSKNGCVNKHLSSLALPDLQGISYHYIPYIKRELIEW